MRGGRQTISLDQIGGIIFVTFWERNILDISLRNPPLSVQIYSFQFSKVLSERRS